VKGWAHGLLSERIGEALKLDPYPESYIALELAGEGAAVELGAAFTTG
jgi:hypothetical protein